MSLKAPSLRELQETLSALIDGKATETQRSKAESWIELSDHELTASERLEIYSDAWYLRLEESLAEDFPTVRRSFSEIEWERVVRAYFHQFPSASFTLARAGDLFPTYLSEQFTLPKWMADVGLFEKALYKALNARDVDVWDVSELQAYDSEAAADLRFEIQPSVCLLQSKWNILALHENSEDSAIDQPEETETFIVVSREGFSPTYRELDASEYDFLKRAAAGTCLGELAEDFQDSNWLQWLSQAAADGLIHPILK